MVWLIYEDDYGSTFSPYVLTKLVRDEDEAIAYCRRHSAIYVGHKDRGDNLANYPQHRGGLFSDD